MIFLNLGLLRSSHMNIKNRFSLITQCCYFVQGINITYQCQVHTIINSRSVRYICGVLGPYCIPYNMLYPSTMSVIQVLIYKLLSLIRDLFAPKYGRKNLSTILFCAQVLFQFNISFIFHTQIMGCPFKSGVVKVVGTFYKFMQKYTSKSVAKFVLSYGMYYDSCYDSHLLLVIS